MVQTVDETETAVQCIGMSCVSARRVLGSWSFNSQPEIENKSSVHNNVE